MSDLMELAGKTAIVTGGATGIGLATLSIARVGGTPRYSIMWGSSPALRMSPSEQFS